jgi:hypothetical protein
LGDGLGYRTVGLGQTVSTYYSGNGEKVLKVKCTLANGQVLESHSVLQVLLNDGRTLKYRFEIKAPVAPSPTPLSGGLDDIYDNGNSRSETKSSRFC